jgi:DNA-binding response OmpR family regulator
MKVLVGDPDAWLVAALRDVLQHCGYTVLTARDGPQVLAVWWAESPDLVLLEDWHLPGLAGFAVTRTLRERGARIPVVLMSEHPTEPALIRGLESGADDYLAKPLSLRQLLARLQALRRRAAMQGQARASKVCVGGWGLDLTTRTVTTPAGQLVRLTRTECCLLHLLLANAGQIVSYARLTDACWGHSDDRPTHLLKSHISHVRRKLGLADQGPRAIEVVQSVGYRLVLPEAAPPPPSTVVPAQYGA